ncbi:MAG: response regulator [Steroidobacteraceae bacterium]|nr:response regulator [Steroidobacteraceae bacterium]
MNDGENDVEELRARLTEAEGNLHAIFSGEIDALLLADEDGERRVYTLRSADAPYRALVERMQEGAATLSVTGDVVYCNQRFADLVRAPLEQVFGASIGRFLPPAEGEILRAMLEHGSGRYQTHLMLNGREATEVQVTLSRIVLDDVEHRTLILSDISSLARAQRENRSKDEFLAMLAHELRNPLGAIQGAVHALTLMNRTGEPMAQRATGIIKRQVVHMARLVDDLLDVGRAVTGKIVLKRGPFNFAEAVKSQITTIASGDPNSQARIDLVAEPVWVHGDVVRLEQIAGNLISNALKFTRGDGVVSVFVGREGDDAVLRVADQGIGIPADMLPKIFELFVQAHHTIDRSRGGLGIGLTLVRRLAEMHGGTVDASSEGDGKGATFVVRIPTVAAPKAGTALKRDGNGAELMHAFESRRVLLVDDNHDSREMYRAVLLAHGHDVRDAPNGEHALALLQGMTSAEALDVAFIDIGLPGGMDGYELARRIRKHPRGADVRLVALTGYGFPEDRLRSKQAGFAKHLVKPVEPDALQCELSAVGRRAS